MSSSKLCPPGCDKFPEDLIYEILLRLPVKSLLRFKTVSKLWCCMISSPGFVDSHCARPGSCAENTLIVKDAFQFSLLQLGHSPLMAYLHFPYSGCNPFDQAIIAGSDRGIVCVTVRKCRLFYLDCSSTYLWNPATNHYKLIPRNTIHNSFDTWNVLFGFGFDPINNDFKVVTVESSSSQAEVYSANLNAWRKVGPMPAEIKDIVCFKGCINGLLCWTELNHILTFDLNKEVFTCVTKPPSDTFNDFIRHAHITDFNDSVVLIIGEGYNSKINLWTLDDVECLRGGGVVEASWTLMLSIDTDVPVHSIHTYFNSGDMLLNSDGANWFSYNSVQKEAKWVSATISWGEIFKYTETLVSITGFEQLKKKVLEHDK